MTNDDRSSDNDLRQGPPLALSPAAREWLQTRGLSCLFGLAMIAAPALGALYGLNVGLGIATAALFASTYLALQALPIAAEEMRPRLRLLAGINAALALVCGVIWALRVFA